MANSVAAFWLRPARRDDDKTIKRLVRRARLNPFGLNWRRFTVADHAKHGIVGCVQLKPHRDGSVELASLVVAEPYRSTGIARALIEKAKAQAEDVLWLMCASHLTSLYERFGFMQVQDSRKMPPYFARIRRMVQLFHAVTRMNEPLAIMRCKPRAP